MRELQPDIFQPGFVRARFGSRKRNEAGSFSLPEAARPSGRRRINSRDWSRLGQSDMGGDHAQTALESGHTRWPPLSILGCIAGSQEGRSRTLSACLKATTSFEGVVQTFINWAEKHPEEGNLTMHLGVVEALSEIWPCD